LYYYALTGQAEIDPTSKGAEPGAKVTGYNLASNNQFFVDPARTSAFPPPSPTFFENTSSVIGDNDLTLAGTSNLLNLRQLFVNAPANQAELDQKFTAKIFVGAVGTGEAVLPAVFIIPEPATAAMGGLCLLGLAFRRRLS
jgi:hypothetical protein